MEDLKQLVEHFQNRVLGNYWMRDDEGNQIERWRYYGIQRRIAQAACNYGGYIVTGTRHYCPLMCLQIDSVGSDRLIEFCGGHDNIIQGLLTSMVCSLPERKPTLLLKKLDRLCVTTVLLGHCSLNVTFNH